ncbi:MAG TPA: DNA adenine methylase [Rhodoferax sp.]
MISKSPLRYPGGKTRFTPFIWSAIQASGLNPSVFVEPFCGGAGVSLALLELGHVQQIALNDIDPLIASFWRIVFGKTDEPDADIKWLFNKIETATLTVDEWRTQKALKPASLREAAFKCLFLNRTSFNGILHQAGPIGGWGQVNRTLDVRFNAEKLVKRLSALYEKRHSVTRVSCENWRLFCSWYRVAKNAYLYLDPPYYRKAEQLYGHTFDNKTHREMSEYLGEQKVPWMLSYDDVPEIRALYGDLSNVDGRVIDQTYSAHPIGGARFVGRELFFSNRPLPTDCHVGQHRGMSVVGTLPTVKASSATFRTPFVHATAN